MELQLEKYEILDEIGQGGMSIVYRGRDPSLHRAVAIKVMHRHLAKDPEARERFAREARAVARLTHHNIPEIYDFSSGESESHYLVTELVEGASLAELIKTHDTLPEVAALIGLGICAALQHAHDHDIVHRDVKPENILVGRDGVVKLTDFGIAQFIGLESMTITGTLVGSPAHMSPEQIADASHLDPRADVWALGTVLYTTATGQLPFQAGTPHAILKKITDGAYADPRRLNPHIDSELRRIIKKCMTVERSQRYPSMNALFVELKAWLDERGLTEPEQEISAWVQDPEGYIKDLSTRLVTALMQRSAEDLANKQRHRALEALNRVLTLDPDNDEAFERVRTLTSGMRLRKLGIQLGAATLAAAVAVGSYFLFTGNPAPSTPSIEARTKTEFERPKALAVPPALRKPGVVAGRAFMDVVIPRAGELAREGQARSADAGRKAGAMLRELVEGRGAELSAAKKVTRIKKNPSNGTTSPTPPKRGTVTFKVLPSTASATLGGKTLRSGTQLTLPVGKQTATITVPVCFEKLTCPPQKKTFTVKGGADPQTVRLAYRWPPMMVRANCQDGVVYLSIKGNKRRVGPCGRNLRVQTQLAAQVGEFSVVFPSGKVSRVKRMVKPGGRLVWDAKE